MLHILNKSPLLSNSLESCLRIAKPNDVILLIEDAVILAIQPLPKTNIKFYALKSDLEARGILDKIISEIQLITFEEFVDLTVQHHPSQTWL